MQRKKIGVNLTYIIDNQASGIRKHAEEIIDGLLKFDDKYEIVIFVDNDLKDVFKSRYPSCKIVPIKFLLRHVRIIRRINRLKIIKNMKKNIIRNENCDVYIYPYVSEYSLLIEGDNKIISILDLIPLAEISDKESKKYKNLEKQNIDLMNETNYIVTLSEYSKGKLLELNPEYKGNIIVIPSAVEKPKETSKKVSDVLGEDMPYILTINSFYKNKNQITLIKAFNLIKDKIQDNLVLVGRPELLTDKSGYGEAVEYVKKHNLTDRVKFLSFIPDEDRNCLLYNADLFVTTSLQEGFGRTPVEAALCEVPVISTKETSLPEATMWEAFYYENATDEVELSEKIIQVLENKPSKERLREIANKLQEEYKDEKIAKEYIKIIEVIDNERKNNEN